MQGLDLSRAQFRGIWRMDKRSFTPAVVQASAVALISGVGAGVLMMIMRSLVTPIFYPEVDALGGRPPSYDVNPFAEAGASRFGSVPGRIVAYAPSAGSAGVVAQRIAETAAVAGGLTADRVQGFADADAITRYHLDHNWDANFGGAPEGADPGVGLTLVLLNETDLSFAVGTSAAFLPWTRGIASDSVQTSDCPVLSLTVEDFDVPSSLCSGLLSWQQLVTRAVAAELGSETAADEPAPPLQVRAVDSSTWVTIADASLSTDVTLGFLYSLGPLAATGSLMGFITTRLVYARRGSRSKADAETAPSIYSLMRIAGMSPLQWWAVKVLFLAPVAIVFAAACTVVSAAAGAFDQVGLLAPNDTGGAGMFFVLVAVATWCSTPLYAIFAAIPLFNNPSNAVAAALRGIITTLLAPAAVALFILVIVPEESVGLDIVTALIVPVGLARGIAQACSAGALATDPTISQPVIVLLMLVGGALNLTLTVLVDRASDGAGCLVRRRTETAPTVDGDTDGEAVVASHITKTFVPFCPCLRHKAKTAVDNVSLRFPAGQVTTLLGHNGAGKTTLINCILGMYTYSGDVTILGERGTGYGGGDAKIGYVTQGNSLDPVLTPREHLRAFATLHGAPDPDAVAEAALELTGLSGGRTPDTPSEKISGGQKRRLALAIATLGDPRCLVLDEPTAGVDAEGKVAIRRMIRQLKRAGRVILMTTHEMTEAEVLSDYTAIMVNGKVQVEARTLELKKTYGVGYYLHVSHRGGTRAGGGDNGRDAAREAKAAAEDAGAAASGAASAGGENDSKQLRVIVQAAVRGAVVARESLVESLFVLPMASAGNFRALFADLDAAGFERLYGIEMPSLEEIFIRITREAEDVHVRKDAVDKARKLAQAKRKAAAGCMVPASVRAEADAAEVDLAKLESELAGATQRDIACPALGCAHEFDAPANALTVTCPSCTATFSRADAAAAKPSGEHGDGKDGGDADADADTTGRAHFDLQPSWKDSYIAFLKFSVYADRQAIASGLFTLVMYLTIAGVLAKMLTGFSIDTLLQPPPKLGADGDSSGSHFSAIGVTSTDSSLIQDYVDGVNAAAGFEMAVGFDDEDALGAWLVDGIQFVDARGGFVFGDDPGNLEAGLKLLYQRTSDGDPFRLLALLQHAEFGAQLGMSALPQVWPLHGGPQYQDFRSTATIGMYICLIVAVLMQSLGAGVAATIQLGVRDQFLSMGVEKSVYYVTLLTIHGGMVLVSALGFTAVMYGAQLPFAVETPVFAVVLVVFVVAASLMVMSWFFIVLIGTLGGWIALSSFLMIAGMVPGMMLNVVPGFAVQHSLALDFYPPGALTQAFANMDRAASVIQFRAAYNCTSCGFPAFTPGNVLDGDARSLLAAVLLPLAYTLVFGVGLVMLELRHAAASRAAAPPVTRDGALDVEAGSAALPLDAEGLEKTFPGPTSCCGLRREAPKHVLRGVNFSVRTGELVALLGPNGAGKSVTFNIISGRYAPTAGSVTVNGKDVRTAAGVQERGRRLYLAQQHTNATLHGMASVRSHLRLYAAVKGVRGNEAIDRAVAETLKLFDLGDRADAKVSELSGGQGRKGCAAIAMLGTVIDDSGKVVVVLDEISAGVDVNARRHMWETFSKVRGNFAGVLCTHHMAEADALCDSIAIVVEGRVVAKGNTQELKNQHGKNAKLHLTCTPEAASDPDTLVAWVSEHVGAGARLVDSSRSSGHVVIDVPVASAPLSQMFQALEAGKGEDAGNGILDYSLAQPTLEQVFIKLVREHSRSLDGASTTLSWSMSHQGDE